MRYVLGLDGGGTKTDAVLMDEAGRILGWGRGGPTHSGFEPSDVTSNAIPDAVGQVLAGREVEIAAAVASFCGRDAIEAVQRLCPSAQVRGAGEIEVIFAANRIDSGLIILASTGSCVLARNRDGRQAHLGGFGPVIGDEGSAHEIGVRGLRACIYAHWSDTCPTSLRERMMQATGCERVGELIGFFHFRGTTRRVIAGLAPIVNEEAEAGDAVAREILEASARELARLAVFALAQVGMLDEPYPMVRAGSVARNSAVYWRQVVQTVRGHAPRIEPRDESVFPAVGSALLALQDIGVDCDEAVYEAAMASWRE